MASLEESLKEPPKGDLRIEIVDFTDATAENLEPYAIRVKETLLQEYPQVSLLWFGLTKSLWNFMHPSMKELQEKCSGYCIILQGEVNPREVKKTCMALELDPEGNRIADIDVYLPTTEKISRKPTLSANRYMDYFLMLTRKI